MVETIKSNYTFSIAHGLNRGL